MKSCFENWEQFHGLNIRYFIIQEEVRSQVGETLRFRFATGSGKGVALRRGKLKGVFLHRQPLFDPVPNIVWPSAMGNPSGKARECFESNQIRSSGKLQNGHFASICDDD